MGSTSPLRWEGRADLADLVGQKIRLRISATDAELYGLTVAAGEAGLG